MPPALSDEEDNSSVDSGAEEIPAKRAEAVAPVKDEDDEEGEEDEYVVEKILGHRIVKGGLEYDVQWQGYDDPSDRTWEPEANLEGALDVVNEYLEEIGGRPEIKAKKRKGKKSVAESKSAAPPANKRIKKERDWHPPQGSWEHDVSYVDNVEELLDSATGQKKKYGYLVWNNSRKTQHPLSHIYQKCPQKMLQYYENHLVFSHNAYDTTNGGDDHDTGDSD